MINSNYSSTLRYHSSAEPTTLLSDLEELRIRSALAKRWRSIYIVALLVSIVLCVAFVHIMGAHDFWFVGILLGVILIIAFGLRIVQFGKLIIDERRRKLVVQLVTALACDAPPKGQFEVTIDFSSYRQPAFLINHALSGRYQLYVYHQPWLKIAGKLADGSSLEYGITTVVQYKERSKTKGRTKTKEDIHEELTLIVRNSSYTPQMLSRWPIIVQNAPWPAGCRIHRALAKKGRIHLIVRTQRAVRVTNKGTVINNSNMDSCLVGQDVLLMPLLATYQSLALCMKEV